MSRLNDFNDFEYRNGKIGPYGHRSFGAQVKCFKVNHGFRNLNERITHVRVNGDKK